MTFKYIAKQDDNSQTKVSVSLENRESGVGLVVTSEDGKYRQTIGVLKNTGIFQTLFLDRVDADALGLQRQLDTTIVIS